MARKTSLRDFQEYLATRLSQAAKGKGAASWLGVEAGGVQAVIAEVASGNVLHLGHGDAAQAFEQALFVLP